MPARSVEIKVDIVSDPNGTAKAKASLKELEREATRAAKEATRVAAEEQKRQDKITADHLAYKVRETKRASAEQVAINKRQEAALLAEVKASQARITAAHKAADKAILASQQASVNAAKAASRTQANALIGDLKRLETGAKSSATNIQGYLKSAFGGGLIGGAVGGFAGALVGQFTSALSSLPSILRTQLDEMVRIASERQNAFKGLESLSRFLGLNTADTQSAVKNLRLVKSGIVDIADASTSLKNLLSSGFSLPEAVKLLEAFSDTAAFGKSAALGFGEAIRGATEGIRNGNSVLVDNVGLTKNLSAILKDAGFAEQDLAKVKDDVNVRQALFNGLLKEALPQMGDADRLTQGWTGNTAALTTAQNNLYAALGDVIIKNAELNALVKTLTGDMNDLTHQVKDTESGWNRSINNMVSSFVNFYQTVEFGVRKEIADLQELVRVAEAAANAIGYAFWVSANPGGAFADYVGGKFGLAPQNPFAGGVSSTYNRMSGAWSQVGSHSRAAANYETSQRAAFGSNLSAQRQSMFGGRSVFNNSPFASPFGVNNVAFPGLLGGGGPGTVLNAGGGRTIDTKNLEKYQKELADLEKLKVTASGNELKAIEKQIARRKAIIENLEAGVGIGAARAAATGGGRGRVRAATNTDERKYTAIVDFAREMGFDIPDPVKSTTGGKHMTGSLHYSGRAVDVRTRDKTAQEVAEFIAEALQRGFRVYDERGKRGQPHLHLEANNRRESTFDTRQSYGNIPLDLLRELDRKRFDKSRGGVSREDVARYYKELGPHVPLKVAGRSINLPLGESPYDPDDLKLGDRSKEIEQNQKVADLYMEMADALFNLNEHTKEEVFLRDYKLGKYGELTEQQAREIANTYRLIDAAEQRKKAEEDAYNEIQRRQQAHEESVERSIEQQERLFEDTARGFEDLLTDLASGNFKSIWKKLLDDMLQQFIRPASLYLAKLFGGAQAPQGGGSGGGGGIFSGILAKLLNRGSGPGGTPNFNPASNVNMGSWGTGTSAAIGGGGGMWGGWNDLKNMQGDLTAGLGGGSTGAGGFNLASLGSMVGPQAYVALATYAIKEGLTTRNRWKAFALLGTVGLISAIIRRSGDTKKLKKAALSTYGITVKDKSVLEALKQLGETMFGKGKAGINAQAVVSSDQGENILRNYAEATGQSTKMIDRKYFADENWSGNQFRSQFGGFRAHGGPVRAGMSYVVGERRAELFTPSQNGHISPTVGMGSQQMQVILGTLEESINILATRLNAMTPGSVLMMGAMENPDAIGDAMIDQASTRQSVNESLVRGSGRAF